MVRFYPCTIGQTLNPELGRQYGPRVEIEAIEFINALPIEWRLVTATTVITQWRASIRHRNGYAFHDLQLPNPSGGTMGTPGDGIMIETRGIGDCTVAIWLRDGTYQESTASRLRLVIPEWSKEGQLPH